MLFRSKAYVVDDGLVGGTRGIHGLGDMGATSADGMEEYIIGLIYLSHQPVVGLKGVLRVIFAWLQPVVEHRIPTNQNKKHK